MPVDYVQPLLSLLVAAAMVFALFEWLRRRQPSNLPVALRGGRRANALTLVRTAMLTPLLLLTAFGLIEGVYALLRAW